MEITLLNKENNLYITSREVAKHLGKEHFTVLRDIKRVFNLDENFQDGYNCVLMPELFVSEYAENFQDGYNCVLMPELFVSEYADIYGRPQPELVLSEEALLLYLFNIEGFNGIKMAFIRRFKEMEAQLHSNETIRLKIADEQWKFQREWNESLKWVHEQDVETQKQLIDELQKTRLERDEANTRADRALNESCKYAHLKQLSKKQQEEIACVVNKQVAEALDNQAKLLMDNERLKQEAEFTAVLKLSIEPTGQALRLQNTIKSLSERNVKLTEQNRTLQDQIEIRNSQIYLLKEEMHRQ